jgi:hypothetical protein
MSKTWTETTGELFNMKQNLSEQINSFGTQARKSIYSVLSEVSNEKNEVGRLVSKLTSFTSAADYAPRFIKQLEPLQKEFIIDMFRDLDLRVKSQFDISNSISNLSSAMANVFGGELEKIEKDLSFLNAYVNEWSFISGEEDLYNSSFIENFDNESNSYINESSTFSIPDRDGINLTQEMLAKVDPVSGKLKYSSNQEIFLSSINSNNIKSISYETNFSKEYISSDTGIEKVLNNLNSKIWSMNVKSPFLIRESLLDSEKYVDFKNNVNVGPSAQVALNIEFNSLVSMSRIRINPNIIDSLGVAQIILETENSQASSSSTLDYKKIPMLKSPVFIQKNYDIDLDKNYNVKSLTIVLFQKEYNRTKVNSVQSEINSKMISEIHKEIKESRKDQHDTLQDFVIKFFLRETDKSFILKNNKIYQYNYTSYYPKSLSKTNFGTIEKLAKDTYFSDLDAFNKFKNTSLLSNIIFSIISFSLGSKLRNKITSTYVESNIRDTPKSVGSFLSSGLIPVSDSNIVDKNIHLFNQTLSSISQQDATEVLNSVQETNMYEYGFSISGIGLYFSSNPLASTQKKSFFLSRKIPLDGRPLKVKMLSKHFEELEHLSEDVAQDKTSVEFSVTTKESPSSESDWLPILPYESSFVRSELLIADSLGASRLRFEPLPESVVLYEDGKARLFGSYSINIRNIIINNYKQSSSYFVSYQVRYPESYKELTLNPGSLATPILVSPSSNGLNGEYFTSTGQSSNVRLNNRPYVDIARLADASYSIYVGTIPSSRTVYGGYDNSSYSPVKVVFQDGTTAINITNYVNQNNQTEIFYETDNILFVHHGDSITFNKKIDKPFTVLYQYIPDSFRYRVIMRSLTNDEQNYTIDRLIFKFSTENRDDMLISLIKYDNLFKNKMN